MEDIINIMISVLGFLGVDIAIPILVSYVTTKITNKIDKDKELPRFLISAPTNGVKPEDDDYKEEYTQLHGYFKMQRNFDIELKEFLKANGVDEDFRSQHVMQELYKAYKNKTYKEINGDYTTRLINEIILRFKGVPKFTDMITRYEKYYNCSKWILNIENVGESPAYNLNINFFEENNSDCMIYNGTLNEREKRKVMIYYFDEALNSENFMFYGNTTTIFFLVNKKKYKEKYERLFKITYNDKFGKFHEIYCCAKVGKNKSINILGAKD